MEPIRVDLPGKMFTVFRLINGEVTKLNISARNAAAAGRAADESKRLIEAQIEEV